VFGLRGPAGAAGRENRGQASVQESPVVPVQVPTVARMPAAGLAERGRGGLAGAGSVGDPWPDKPDGTLTIVSNDSAPPGKELKYARPERERRFLLSARPEGRVLRTVRIADRYLLETRIRLRQETETTGLDGGVARVVYKLTQKIPAPGGGPGLITTMYLNATEYARLAQLPAASLRKTRLSIPPLGVDVFEDALAGLVLGEAEFADDESMAGFVAPAGAVAEVTHDQRLSGGQLAVMTAPEIAAVLAAYGVPARVR
jgi:hypothetical protein